MREVKTFFNDKPRSAGSDWLEGVLGMPIALRAMRGCVASGFHLSLLTPAVPTVQFVFRESKRSAAMKLTRHRSSSRQGSSPREIFTFVVPRRSHPRGSFFAEISCGYTKRNRLLDALLTRQVARANSYSRGTHRAPPASSFFRICVSGDHPKLLGSASLADTSVGVGQQSTTRVSFFRICVSGDHPKLLGDASLADTAVGMGSLVRLRLPSSPQRAFRLLESA